MDVAQFPLVSVKSKEEFNDFRNLFNLNFNFPIVIAGPCSLESKQIFEDSAKFLKSYGVNFLRAGLYKPRTSPYDFQGLRRDGLKMTKYIAEKYDIKTVAEVTDVRELELILQYVDVVQIGSRNMQNFDFLKEVGRLKCPVILKRGMCSTVSEFILAAEYIALGGNRNILLCERGIRTFENSVRNTLDVVAIALVKKYTKLPIIADLSHSLGRKDVINEVAKSVLVAGADGIMVEVHPKVQEALSDKKQQLDFCEFKRLISEIKKLY